MDNEQIAFNIIMYAGNARAKAYDAVAEAKKGDFNGAYSLIKESGDEIIKAHNIQNSIITREANGDHFEITLLMVHAEDHLMSAISAKDYASEMIELYKRLNEKW